MLGIFNKNLSILKEINYSRKGYKLPQEGKLAHKIESVMEELALSNEQLNVLAYIAGRHPEAIDLSDYEFNDLFCKIDIINQLYYLEIKHFIYSFESDDTQFYAIDHTGILSHIILSVTNEFDENDFIEDIHSNVYEVVESKSWMEEIYEKLKSSNLENAKDIIINVLRIQDLPDNEQMAFWLMIIRFINNFAEPLECSNNDIATPNRLNSAKKIIEGLSSLCKKGIVISIPSITKEDGRKLNSYLLSLDIVKKMFKGCDDIIKYDQISKYVSIVHNSKIQKKDLYFSSDIQETIGNIKKMLSDEGFKNVERILSKKWKVALQFLFWGPPGTGKTEVVNQLAKDSGRDLFIFSAARVIDSLWGATEKNYEELFRSYGYIVAISSKIPILMLNEADQCLSKRVTTIDRSIDKSENVLSNIILEAFENLEGIVMATTNLIENMDEAFDRRFIFKVEMNEPDAQARKYIWKSMIDDLSDSEADYLATKYEMTGAQISNVVRKRELAELYFEGERDIEFIENLCNGETKVKFGGKKVRRIGYHQ